MGPRFAPQVPDPTSFECPVKKPIAMPIRIAESMAVTLMFGVIGTKLTLLARNSMIRGCLRGFRPY